MKSKVHSCPVCGHTKELRLLCAVADFNIYACGVCKADHVFPAPDEKILKAYYDRSEWFEGGEPGGYQNYDSQTEWSVGLVEAELENFAGQTGLSVLDIGCGYGTHLAAAVKRGWKCFGVELSDHARSVAQERLGNAAHLVETVSDLIPHEFDLILMLDTIEHLSSPYPILYQLFALGAVTPRTQLVITTPNAGSDAARDNPAEWAYRHPPSHLVYYSAESLQALLHRLRFKEILIAGLHGVDGKEDIGLFAGLTAKASGSDFTEFMRERYVPGTWSKVAEYEHLPRYALAKKLSREKQLLDFGCGTGYGSALLAENAASVIGLDIDTSAIDWATQSHRNPRLKFHQCDDLGASLPASSVDVVTCFEMIEHVDHSTQQATIRNIARLLREDGLLVISTPNPEVTKLYGENPYHLREMTEDEFLELLKVEFPYVKVLRQLVRNSITFTASDNPAVVEITTMHTGEQQNSGPPLAYIAICSRQPLPEISNLTLFDDEVDLVADYLSGIDKLNKERLSAYGSHEKLIHLGAVSDALNESVTTLHEVVDAKNMALESQTKEILRLNGMIEEKHIALESQTKEILRLNGMIEEKHIALESQAREIHRLNYEFSQKDVATQLQASEISTLMNIKFEYETLKETRWFKLGNQLRVLDDHKK